MCNGTHPWIRGEFSNVCPECGLVAENRLFGEGLNLGEALHPISSMEPSTRRLKDSLYEIVRDTHHRYISEDWRRLAQVELQLSQDSQYSQRRYFLARWDAYGLPALHAKEAYQFYLHYRAKFGRTRFRLFQLGCAYVFTRDPQFYDAMGKQNGLRFLHKIRTVIPRALQAPERTPLQILLNLPPAMGILRDYVRTHFCIRKTFPYKAYVAIHLVIALRELKRQHIPGVRALTVQAIADACGIHEGSVHPTALTARQRYLIRRKDGKCIDPRRNHNRKH